MNPTKACHVDRLFLSCNVNSASCVLCRISITCSGKARKKDSSKYSLGPHYPRAAKLGDASHGSHRVAAPMIMFTTVASHTSQSMTSLTMAVQTKRHNATLSLAATTSARIAEFAGLENGRLEKRQTANC